MKLEELFPHSFRNLRKSHGIPRLSGPGLIEQCRADDSAVCQQMMADPYSLSESQMRHAAARYRIGKSRSGKAIYWMIDELGIVHDGHIGGSWVSAMLKSRYPETAPYVIIRHCLFGLHLLTQEEPADSCRSCSVKTVSVVESERSAVILSEIYPQSLWMAYAYAANFSERLLQPLQGHRVILFPNADETGSTYLAFLEVADQARRRYNINVAVSPLLEDGTTKSQKSRHIDLLDYWVESIRNKATIHLE